MHTVHEHILLPVMLKPGGGGARCTPGCARGGGSDDAQAARTKDPKQIRSAPRIGSVDTWPFASMGTQIRGTQDVVNLRVLRSMAGIDVGNLSKRSVNRELPLVPFIDCLLCLVAFLLVTAVWNEMARLEASAQVPRLSDGPPHAVSPELHVDLRNGNRVVLEWRDGTTVLSREELSRESLGSPGVPGRRAFEQALARLWSERGGHRAPTDPSRDRAIVHASNAAPFEEIAAAMDAVASVKRPSETAAKSTILPAFDVVFAVD